MLSSEVSASSIPIEAHIISAQTAGAVKRRCDNGVAGHCFGLPKWSSALAVGGTTAVEEGNACLFGESLKEGCEESFTVDGIDLFAWH